MNGAGGGAAASATATPDGMTPVPALLVAATWLIAGLLALPGVKVPRVPGIRPAAVVSRESKGGE